MSSPPTDTGEAGPIRDGEGTGSVGGLVERGREMDWIGCDWCGAEIKETGGGDGLDRRMGQTSLILGLD